MIQCEICLDRAEGEVIYVDGEVSILCAECLLDVVEDPAKPVHRIIEYDNSNHERAE